MRQGVFVFVLLWGGEFDNDSLLRKEVIVKRRQAIEFALSKIITTSFFAKALTAILGLS